MAWFVGMLAFLWHSFTLWLHNLFVAPFANPESLWILIPVWLAMILAEIFQEKHGTSMGNAVSNSVVVFWGGIDFLRVTTNTLGSLTFGAALVRYLIAFITILYGMAIVILGVKGNESIRVLARVREVSYVIIIFAPVYYGTSALSWSYLFGAVAFFWLFYVAIEVLNRFLPDPEAFVKDVKAAAQGDI